MDTTVPQLFFLIVGMVVIVTTNEDVDLSPASARTKRESHHGDTMGFRNVAMRVLDDDQSDRGQAQSSQFSATFNNRASSNNDGDNTNARRWGMGRNMRQGGRGGSHFRGQQRPANERGRTGQAGSRNEEDTDYMTRLEYAACCNAGNAFCEDVDFPKDGEEEQRQIVAQYNASVYENAPEVAEDDDNESCIQNYGRCCFKSLIGSHEYPNPFSQQSSNQEQSRQSQRQDSSQRNRNENEEENRSNESENQRSDERDSNRNDDERANNQRNQDQDISESRESDMERNQDQTDNFVDENGDLLPQDDGNLSEIEIEDDEASGDEVLGQFENSNSNRASNQNRNRNYGNNRARGQGGGQGHSGNRGHGGGGQFRGRGSSSRFRGQQRPSQLNTDGGGVDSANGNRGRNINGEDGDDRNARNAGVDTNPSLLQGLRQRILSELAGDGRGQGGDNAGLLRGGGVDPDMSPEEAIAEAQRLLEELKNSYRRPQ